MIVLGKEHEDIWTSTRAFQDIGHEHEMKRQDLWLEAYKVSSAYADEKLKEFDKRFPAPKEE